MRFYVPEWDDAVDAHYDFEHDEHSALTTDARERHFIWDIFDYESIPIDGVLISREQVEGTSNRADRVREHGVHNPKSGIGIPDWLPTISDCGAWGYKSLPFPPYGNEGMLSFYEDLGVQIGVTIDHLVLGSGKESRLYLDERAFEDADISEDDLPTPLTNELDVMVDEWPKTWPDYVADYDSTICDTDTVEPFTEEDFWGSTASTLERLDDDPRAVYRENDTQTRYRITLNNAAEMKEHYEAGEYPFRLMCAIQGTDPTSYAHAAEEVLELGYQYIGIGGVAGSNADGVRQIVSAVGNSVKEHERAHETRVDTHVFGFAKPDAFETVGRSGMTSFDSASMLRSAWTGGNNYHLDNDRQYDAFRVRYGSNRLPLEERIQTALRAQVMLRSFRAFDAGESVLKAIEEAFDCAEQALDNVLAYLRDHRHDDGFDERILRDVEAHFRDDYTYGRELRASFGRPFRKKIIKLLRADDPDDPLDFDEYETLIDTARTQFLLTHVEVGNVVDTLEDTAAPDGSFEQTWPVVSDYVSWIKDDRLLEEYRRLLTDRPWEECDCRICNEHGIEVAIFRGNNRNRRRGFHNTRRFYDQFTEALPKSLILAPATSATGKCQTAEAFLQENWPRFWSAVHDLPVAEIGALSDSGIHEWWEDSPDWVTPGAETMADQVLKSCARFQHVFIYDPDRQVSESITDTIQEADCTIDVFSDSDALRSTALDRFGYESEFLPGYTVQKDLIEF